MACKNFLTKALAGRFHTDRGFIELSDAIGKEYGDYLKTNLFNLEEKGFINIETVEILVRRFLVRRNRTRPEQRMPSHTGWLTFATKITA